jgi:hypothetical protein
MSESEPIIKRRRFVKTTLGAAFVTVLGGAAILSIKSKKVVKRAVYNLDLLGKIDPSLIQYKQYTKPINTGFSGSRAIALDSKGSIYIAGDRAMRVFNQGGDLLKEITLEGTPRSLFLTEEDMLYIAMSDHVKVFDKQFKQTANWRNVSPRSVLTSIAVSKDHVFVADAGNRIVVHYNTAGEILNYIGKKDNPRNIPGFVVPSPYFDLAVAPDGLLRVANPGYHRIEAYTFHGDLEFAWGKPTMRIEGFCGCCNPVNFAMLPDESFVTCEKGLLRVKVYDPDGSLKAVVAGPGQLAEEGTCQVCTSPAKCGSGGFDLTTDNKGRIFVLDTIKNLVRTFTKTEQI